MAGPAARGDQHDKFDERLGQAGAEAQMLAERLHAMRKRRVVQQGEEGSAHAAARPAGVETSTVSAASTRSSVSRPTTTRRPA